MKTWKTWCIWMGGAFWECFPAGSLFEGTFGLKNWWFGWELHRSESRIFATPPKGGLISTGLKTKTSGSGDRHRSFCRWYISQKSWQPVENDSKCKERIILDIRPFSTGCHDYGRFRGMKTKVQSRRKRSAFFEVEIFRKEPALNFEQNCFEVLHFLRWCYLQNFPEIKIFLANKQSLE